jgi:hypothetical protein
MAPTDEKTKVVLPAEVPDDLPLPSDQKRPVEELKPNGNHYGRPRDPPKNHSRMDALLQDKRQTEEQVAHSLKRRSSKTSVIAVGAIRIRNFGATLSRRSRDGCCRARRNSGVRHNVQCCAEEEVGRRNMVGQDALARASSTPRTDPGTLRASARTAPWRMLTEADSTCG